MNEQSDEDQEDGSHSLPIELVTTRLKLRAPLAGDAGAIAKLANNRRIAEQTRRMPYPFSQGDAEQWLDKVSGGGETVFLITGRCSGEILGAAGCGQMDETDLEVGYWIGEQYWGMGYATEAVQAVVDHVFDAGEVERLYGRCRVVNMASRRVLMKCGFQFVGSGMSDSCVLKGLVPVEEYALERSVWVSLKRWGKAS